MIKILSTIATIFTILTAILHFTNQIDVVKIFNDGKKFINDLTTTVNDAKVLEGDLVEVETTIKK